MGRILMLAALAALCLTLSGPAGARAGAGPPPDPAACGEPPAEGSVCSSLQIGLSASPNPTPAGGTVSFSWSVTPETDCWDNLGNGAWGGYSFSAPVSEPFTWVVSCSGSGIESTSLHVGVDGSGGGPPPPPPPGDHDPKGYLDMVDAGASAASGWTCDPDAYGAALDVHFYVDGPAGTGTYLGRATAGQTREQAVGDLCGGTVSHGYAFALPASVQDGTPHELYAYAINVGDGDNVQLIGSPKSFLLGTPPGCSGVVVLYELPNYGGRCWSFDVGEFSSLADADNLASSIRVADGYAASLFGDPGFAGSLANSADAPDAGSWTGVGDDNASSLVVQSTGSYGEFEGEYEDYPFPQALSQGMPRAGCKQVADASQYHSYVRNRREWYLLLTLKFCWDGRIVTRIYESEAEVWTAPIPWPLSYISSWQASYVKQQDFAGSPSALARVDATIAFCGFRFGCPRTHRPWVKLVITGKGQATCFTNYAPMAHACWQGPA